VKLNLLVSCFALVACGGGSISEDKFLEQLGKKSCQLAFECADEAGTEPDFNDVGQCEEFWAGITQPQGGEADCEYDGDAAGACIDAIDQVQCDDKNVDIPAGRSITPAAKTAYLANTAVVPATSAGLTMTHIMLQKYIALYGWGTHQTWTDMRKFHYTAIDPATAVPSDTLCPE
jgi:hypothetical protein